RSLLNNFPTTRKRIERSTTMLVLKYLLVSAGIAMFVIAAGILTYDAYLLIAWQRRRLNLDPAAGAPEPAPPIRWRTSIAFAMLAWAPLLISAGIVIVPSGMAGVRVSQTKGTLAGTLYPGVHFVLPLIERVDRRRAYGGRGRDPETESAADQQSRSRAPL